MEILNDEMHDMGVCRALCIETPKIPLHFCKFENIISHNVDSIL